MAPCAIGPSPLLWSMGHSELSLAALPGLRSPHAQRHGMTRSSVNTRCIAYVNRNSDGRRPRLGKVGDESSEETLHMGVTKEGRAGQECTADVTESLQL